MYAYIDLFFSVWPCWNNLLNDAFRGRCSCARWDEFVAHRFFAQEEVVDDEEEVFPRGHDHPGACLACLAPLPPTHALSPTLHPSTQLWGAAAGDRSMEPGCAASHPGFLQESSSPAVQAARPIYYRGGAWADSTRGCFTSWPRLRQSIWDKVCITYLSHFRQHGMTGLIKNTLCVSKCSFKAFSSWIAVGSHK